MTQYSKRMVIVHWLTLVLLIAAWLLGDALHDARHEGSATLLGYVVHGLVGGTVLLFTLARMYFRNKDGVPPPLGNTLPDKVAKGIHYALYAVLILVPVSGMMQTLTSDVYVALTAWDASLLPKKFTGVTAHEVHEILVNVLIALSVVHVLGALKHQFLDKDGIMTRMSLHRR
ncbi:MAG TPA: cytochrome b/b6 domain-containing protein [Gallionella sp.]|jgi:cytochrome b561|nr:cytochrome b/b6 domain-containing protein [Gallionella sp.]